MVETLNVVANLAIVIWYVLVPILWLPHVKLARSVAYAGVLFFLTCAITHLSMALGFAQSSWMVIDHLVQAGAVTWFVFGFHNQLVRASGLRRREEYDGGQPQP